MKKKNCIGFKTTTIALLCMCTYMYVCIYVLDAITSLGIVFGKLKLGRTFDFDKQDAIDYKKFSNPIPCAGAQKQSHKSK